MTDKRLLRLLRSYTEIQIVNPEDLIHAAPAIAKGAGALAAAIPFTGIVKRMLGPPADEVAEMCNNIAGV